MEDSDVPPLEDMTEAFSNCLKLREQKYAKVPARNEVLELPDDVESEKLQAQRIAKLLGKEASETTEIRNNKPHNKDNVATDIRAKKASSDTFCGFKKGFLTAQKKESKKTTKVNKSKKESEEITVLTKKVSEDRNVLPEVQEAINQQIPYLKSNDWVTEELLTKISCNPKLLERLMNPRFAAVIEQFQSNPEHIMNMCQKDPEMKVFIQDFCAIMGEHFTELGEKENQKEVNRSMLSKGTVQSDDEKKIQSILSDPEISAIIKTPEIQKLLMTLKEEPEKARKILQSADGALRQKIQKLIDTGLVQMAS